ncbi:125_t:CDS:2 [Paraglomus brasilianum]|uniref:125_t:CDS:1 n=1 Tax=Paraglomus brasilianum TaxID=144538 RepID=A0A9N9G4Y6_9GLOM|nr:125_t:CDS:2 [Paraglomus brasilianum]
MLVEIMVLSGIKDLMTERVNGGSFEFHFRMMVDMSRDSWW